MLKESAIMANIEWTDSEIAALSDAIMKMAVLWEKSMSKERLAEYLYTLTVQNTTMPFDKLMRSMALARMQDHDFPMPSDILQRELRH